MTVAIQFLKTVGMAVLMISASMLASVIVILALSGIMAVL